MRIIQFLIIQLPIIDDLNMILNFVNSAFAMLFFFLKYALFLVLFIIGITTLLKLRRNTYNFKKDNKQQSQFEENWFKKSHVIIGTIYIIFSIGILFNFLTYLLIYVLDPLPDRIFIYFLNETGFFDPPIPLQGFIEIGALNDELVRFFCYINALGSFGSTICLFASFWQLAGNDHTPIKKSLTTMVSGLVVGILTGFNTFMPLIL